MFAFVLEVVQSALTCTLDNNHAEVPYSNDCRSLAYIGKSEIRHTDVNAHRFYASASIVLSVQDHLLRRAMHSECGHHNLCEYLADFLALL